MCQGPLGAPERLSDLHGAGLLLPLHLQLPSGNLTVQGQYCNPVFFALSCSILNELSLRRCRFLFVICLLTLCNPWRELPNKPPAQNHLNNLALTSPAADHEVLLFLQSPFCFQETSCPSNWLEVGLGPLTKNKKKDLTQQENCLESAEHNEVPRCYRLKIIIINEPVLIWVN